tara:strand:- start:107 stop:838 length:732 start_codon:yes stop_codon:yes gene_type:complete
MATHLQLRQLVSRRLDQPLTANDIPTSGVFWVRQEVTDWLNEASRQLWAEIAEVENITLLTETDGAYTANARNMNVRTLLGGISDDPLKIEEVRDVSNDATGVGRLIDFMNHRNFSSGEGGSEWPGRGSASRRRAWTWYGHNPMQIKIFPVPSTSVTLRVRYIAASPAALSGDADVPSHVPTVHHELLVLYAVVQAKKKEENVSWKDDWQQYLEILSRFRESIEERQAQSGRMVHVTDPAEYG